MKKYNKWEDLPREDLSMIPKMERCGWKCEFSYQDRHYKRVSPDSVPHDPIIFYTHDTYCWHCSKGWAVAEIIDDHYRNHRYYNTLEEVLNNE